MTNEEDELDFGWNTIPILRVNKRSPVIYKQKRIHEHIVKANPLLYPNQYEYQKLAYSKVKRHVPLFLFNV